MVSSLWPAGLPVRASGYIIFLPQGGFANQAKPHCALA